MDALRPKHQIRKRQGIKSLGFRTGPIVPDRPDVMAAVPFQPRSLNHCSRLLLFIDKFNDYL
jgi:hypothetical protein